MDMLKRKVIVIGLIVLGIVTVAHSQSTEGKTEILNEQLIKQLQAQIEQLQAIIKTQQAEIQRLKALCREAGIDPNAHEEEKGLERKEISSPKTNGDYRAVSQEDIDLYKDYEVAYLSNMGSTSGGFTLGMWIGSVLQLRAANKVEGEFYIKKTTSEIVFKVTNEAMEGYIHLSCDDENKICLPTSMTSPSGSVVNCNEVFQAMAIMLP